jgi:hypothetical protein
LWCLHLRTFRYSSVSLLPFLSVPLANTYGVLYVSRCQGTADGRFLDITLHCDGQHFVFLNPISMHHDPGTLIYAPYRSMYFYISFPIFLLMHIYACRLQACVRE